MRGTRVSYRLQGLNEKMAPRTVSWGVTHTAAQKGPPLAGCSDVIILKFLTSVTQGALCFHCTLGIRSPQRVQEETVS